ncbi:kinase-like protein [Penicillium macrosclerotiorum]|uniref:kinase-like protein n=1 Tax=Penicillium macrosclerotiorum TaxID=303699 RepID=UPI002546FD5C|nr:kinase-like protein [Penicillium macrosclerotiorum]KAJ5682923.1 kinase-like protein [Penicillium macrosclerotiorum]
MSALPDLVRDSKLSTTFSSKYTTHLVFDSSAGPQKQTRRKQYEERWAKSKALGSKPFGRVWLEECAVSKGPAKLRAVKQIPKTDIGSKPDSWHRELEAIIKFSHQKYDGCFVRSSGWFEDTESIFIAMEYIPKGDLSEHLAGPLPEVEARKITYQILEGIQFMHENSFAHRDLKPANIFVVTAGPDWWVKIGDFGISKRIDDGQTALRTINGTPGFIAPEIVAQLFDVANWANFSYTLAVDLWSLGVICFFMLTGRLPFHKTYDLMTYFRGDMRGSDIFSDIHDDHKISKEASSFMKTLLAAQPTNRGRVAGALSHVWLQGLKLSPLPSGSIHTETLRVSRSNISRISMVESDASAQWSVIDPPTADTVPKYETPQTSIIVCHEEKCERNDPSRRFPTIDDLERHKKNVHPDSLELDPQKIMYPCFGKNCPRPNRRRRLRDLKHHLHRYHPSENESKLIKK